MTEITDEDLDVHAASTTQAAAAVGQLAASPRLTAEEKERLVRLRDAMIDSAAMLSRSVRMNRDMDALIFDPPNLDLIVQALRDRLTPAQRAQLAARLAYE